MKKFILLFIVMISFFSIPFAVFADDGESEDEKIEEKNKEVKVYFFHGDGCPHCAEAKEFFDSIEEEYGDLFELVSYETWKNDDNAEGLQKIGEIREENIEGVPYILIGNKSWPGYIEDFNDDIIESIKEEYEVEVDERYDIMELIDYDFVKDGDSHQVEDKDYSNDVITLILILIVGAGIVSGVAFARKKTV